MTSLVALNGKAMFRTDDVAVDVEAAPDQRGPFYAWMLFIWKVNSMVPETFSTNKKSIKVEHNSPARGWTTETYRNARVLIPPSGTDNQVLIQADDVRLFHVWDQAMQQVVSGDIHKH